MTARRPSPEARAGRVVRAIRRAGAEVRRVEIDEAGKVVVICTEDGVRTAADPDDWLKRLQAKG